jgi:hypothetical protein
MAWVEALLTKLFLEEGMKDVEGFKALERSFSHQHRGLQSHSHFMRPLCQSSSRAPRTPKEEFEEASAEQEKGPPTIVINGSTELTTPKIPVRRSNSSEGRGAASHNGDKEQSRGTPKEKGKKATTKGNKSPKIGTETPTKELNPKPARQHGSRHPHPPPSSPRKELPAVPVKGNIFTYVSFPYELLLFAKRTHRLGDPLDFVGFCSANSLGSFMPYLHFETKRRQLEMQEAIKRAEKMQSPHPRLKKAATYDEMLIRAHLATSTVSLHVRRTLDQSFYHNIDTEDRDQDQVVYRYQIKGKNLNECDPKIVMVDQLWMWILGPDLIVTSFPQRWQQPRNDPLNVLDSVIEDINSKTRDTVKSVYDLAMIITNRCTGVFDRHRMGDDEYQFLDMFESSIGNATDRESQLFKEFNRASSQASAWLQRHGRRNHLFKHSESDLSDEARDVERDKKDDKAKFEEYMRGPFFVDKLLDIGQETDLLAETKDIRDELNMIKKVFEDQRQVLRDLEDAMYDVLEDNQSQREVRKRFKDQLKTIEMHLKDIERMDKQAERIYSSITDMLDLKQKHANAFEARFARDQAAGTARQSQTIMVSQPLGEIYMLPVFILEAWIFYS